MGSKKDPQQQQSKKKTGVFPINKNQVDLCVLPPCNILSFLAPPGALSGVVFLNLADNLPLSLRYLPPRRGSEVC